MLITLIILVNIKCVVSVPFLGPKAFFLGASGNNRRLMIPGFMHEGFPGPAGETHRKPTSEDILPSLLSGVLPDLHAASWPAKHENVV
jgi:hypothetical protein